MPDGPLVFGIDETLERRRGRKIAAKGIYRDAVRSSHTHCAKASGLRWACLMLLVLIPWAGRTWALPVLTALAPSERYDLEHGRRHKALAFSALGGVPAVGYQVGMQTLLQRSVADAYRGRIFGALDTTNALLRLGAWVSPVASAMSSVSCRAMGGGRASRARWRRGAAGRAPIGLSCGSTVAYTQG